MGVLGLWLCPAIKVERAGSKPRKRIVDLPLVRCHLDDLATSQRSRERLNLSSYELSGEEFGIQPNEVSAGVVVSLVFRRREDVWQVKGPEPGTRCDQIRERSYECCSPSRWQGQSLSVA